MSTYFTDIQGALRERLSTMPNLPPIVWENKNYKPGSKTLYLRATSLPGDTVQECLGAEGLDGHVGVFQVDVFIPNRKGRSTLPDEIADHFYRQILTVNEVDVRITSVSLAPANKDENFYIVPVSISYQVFTNARTT